MNAGDKHLAKTKVDFEFLIVSQSVIIVMMTDCAVDQAATRTTALVSTAIKASLFRACLIMLMLIESQLRKWTCDKRHSGADDHDHALHLERSLGRLPMGSTHLLVVDLIC